jgi:hypothetical protein
MPPFRNESRRSTPIINSEVPVRVRWSFLWRTILASVGGLVGLIAAFFGAIALLVFMAMECSPRPGDSHLPSYARPYELTGEQRAGSGVTGNSDAVADFYFYASNSGIEDVRSAIRRRLVAHHWRVFDDGIGDVGDPWYAASDGTTCLRFISFDRDSASRVELSPEPSYRGSPTMKQIVGSRGTILSEIGDFEHLILIASQPCEFRNGL